MCYYELDVFDVQLDVLDVALHAFYIHDVFCALFMCILCIYVFHVGCFKLQSWSRFYESSQAAPTYRSYFD